MSFHTVCLVGNAVYEAPLQHNTKAKEGGMLRSQTEFGNERRMLCKDTMISMTAGAVLHCLPRVIQNDVRGERRSSPLRKGQTGLIG